MNKKIPKIIFIVIIIGLLFGYPTYFLLFNLSKDIKHETNRWAIVKDYDGNQLAIEPENSNVWEELVEYNKNELQMYILGIIVPYDNLWQFRFEPSTISVYKGSIRSPNAKIVYIANNLEHLLYDENGINIASIRFFEHKYNGIIELAVVDLVFFLSLLIFTFYLVFTNKTQKQYELIKGSLLEVKEDPEGISLARLSQKVDLDQKRVEQLITKRNLKEDLCLLITNDCIQFKDLIYSKSVFQIEEQLDNILQLSHNQLTLEHYSKLFQFKTDLNEVLLFFTKDSSNVEKQKQIETKIEVITNLLESITLDDFK